MVQGQHGELYQNLYDKVAGRDEDSAIIFSLCLVERSGDAEGKCHQGVGGHQHHGHVGVAGRKRVDAKECRPVNKKPCDGSRHQGCCDHQPIAEAGNASGPIETVAIALNHPFLQQTAEIGLHAAIEDAIKRDCRADQKPVGVTIDAPSVQEKRHQDDLLHNAHSLRRHLRAHAPQNARR